MTCSRSKALESKIEALELENQDLKGDVSQLKEQMAQMFQNLSQTKVVVTAMANHSVVGHALTGNTIVPLPHVVRDPPYGMPYEWNVGTSTNEEQEQPETKAQHQASRTTRPSVVHRQTPLVEDKWQSLEERLRAVEGGSQRVKTWRDLVEAFLKQYEYNKDMASDHSWLQNMVKRGTRRLKGVRIEMAQVSSTGSTTDN
ncbi:hypothetical protein CR513_36559, partial [Mucuna pruriens]